MGCSCGAAHKGSCLMSDPLDEIPTSVHLRGSSGVRAYPADFVRGSCPWALLLVSHCFSKHHDVICHRALTSSARPHRRGLPCHPCSHHPDCRSAARSTQISSVSKAKAKAKPDDRNAVPTLFLESQSAMSHLRIHMLCCLNVSHNPRQASLQASPVGPLADYKMGEGTTQRHMMSGCHPLHSWQRSLQCTSQQAPPPVSPDLH